MIKNVKGFLMVRGIEVEQAYLNLRQAAQYLGIGLSTAKRTWPEWGDKGCKARRYPKHTLRFKKEDLDKLMDAHLLEKGNI
jgi:hypothetical protein